MQVKDDLTKVIKRMPLPQFQKNLLSLKEIGMTNDYHVGYLACNWLYEGGN
jgi:hypothetical protein